jgi:hypothetical protein
VNRAENKGSWTFFESITFASTVPEIIAYFAKHGIALTEDDIDVGSHGTLISIPDHVVVDLVNDKLQGQPLRKWPCVARRWFMKHELPKQRV